MQIKEAENLSEPCLSLCAFEGESIGGEERERVRGLEEVCWRLLSMRLEGGEELLVQSKVLVNEEYASIVITDLLTVWYYTCSIDELVNQFKQMNSSLLTNSTKGVSRLIRQIYGVEKAPSNYKITRKSYMNTGLVHLDSEMQISGVSIVWNVKMNSYGTRDDQTLFIRQEFIHKMYSQDSKELVLDTHRLIDSVTLNLSTYLNRLVFAPIQSESNSSPLPKIASESKPQKDIRPITSILEEEYVESLEEIERRNALKDSKIKSKKRKLKKSFV